MAPTKRKNIEGLPSSSIPGPKESRPLKRAKNEGNPGPMVSVSQASRIVKQKFEESPFPRGGAGILTPLEHKQVQLDATRDVLFEQHSGSRIKISGAGKKAVHEPSRGSSKWQRVPLSRKGTGPKANQEEGIRIEGLSYKRLHRGSLVLGQVSEINAHDIALALPNNLTGYVPITSISIKLNEKLERIAQQVDGDIPADDLQNREDIDLNAIFSIGQYFRAFVVSTEGREPQKASETGKRRIELSLMPREANSGITRRELVPNSMVMASVLSVEDRGLVVDLGLEDEGLRGFISSEHQDPERNLSSVIEGAPLFCTILGVSPNGQVVKLSTEPQRVLDPKKNGFIVKAASIDVFLPGTGVEVLLTEITSRGIVGTIMGMINVTADLIHSGSGFTTEEDWTKNHKVGSKVKARIICTFSNVEPRKLGVSTLPHVLDLTSQKDIQGGSERHPLEVIPLSTIIDQVKVQKVVPKIGLFAHIGVEGIPGFIHISRVTDKKIEALLENIGPYKVGSHHRGRVVAYNGIDGVYIVSLEQKILDQEFLRFEDVQVGQIVDGTIERLIMNSTGVGGILVNLADGITGLVPEVHISDISLLHPEKKFKEGMKVKCRVLSKDTLNKRIRLTLKKTLINSELPLVASYNDVVKNMQCVGTIGSISSGGAVVQFYGDVRGFLPVSEMSEAYINDPKQHFRIGQVVNIYVLSIDIETRKLIVSCKDPSVIGFAQLTAFKHLNIGDEVGVTVTEKANEVIACELEDSGLKAILTVGHLTDGSDAKNMAVLKRIRVGQTLQNVLILNKFEDKCLIVLTNKPSLLEAARNQTLPKTFEGVAENELVPGFVKNITQTGVFVEFAGGLTGLLPKSKITPEAISRPDFGLRPLQSLITKVYAVDNAQRRFWLSTTSLAPPSGKPMKDQDGLCALSALNPVDETLNGVEDLTQGKLTYARIASVKETQLNVQLADNIQGRVDVSQIYDNWEDIRDRKHPLKIFTSKQIIPVRVIGIHDARNHRFLPITHQTGKNPVFELSAKPSDQTAADIELLTLESVENGSSWIAYVNNIGDDCLWVNLSPNIRGRIQVLDISDDVSLLNDLETHYPIGSAIKVRVIGINVERNRLDLSARALQTTGTLTFNDLSRNLIIPGKVTKINEGHIMVQLSESVSAPVNLTDLSDDYSQANPMEYSKIDLIRVCVTDIDVPNKKVRLSTRPSKILNSALSVQDPEITSISQLKVNDVVRGFVKNVADNGLFINLGGNVTAYVRITDLSDSFLKDWKSAFQIYQLVKGKVILSDEKLNHVQLSLKASVLEKDYSPPLTFQDLQLGQVIKGKIRKVEDFGVFIVVDGSANVSGLCHKTEMADGGIDQVRSLYSEGDKVRARVLKIDAERRRVSFGLKSSYLESFDAFDDDEEVEGEGKGDEGVEISSSEKKLDTSIGTDKIRESNTLVSDGNANCDKEGNGSHFQTVENAGSSQVESGYTLDPGRFVWNPEDMDSFNGQGNDGTDSDTSDNRAVRKRPRRPTIKVDRTGDLDSNSPASASDFERQLLGQPDSSQLWIQYMAFQMKFRELEKARDTAERAIRSISIREEVEKLNVWIALLNLENEYGTEETTEETFKRACQYNDAQEIHERLISVYIQSSKYSKADELFGRLIKQFSQSPNVWYNYAHFLYNTLSMPDRGRALLPRALQSLASHNHLNLTAKFAALEFHSSNGSPERGRTMFEGLLSTFPKRIDLWNQLLDLEIKQENKDIVRSVFERATKIKGLRPKFAKAWFRRWKNWEENWGDAKSLAKVQAKAEEWVRASMNKTTANE